MKKDFRGDIEMEKMWLDYLENELDPSMRADAELLLKNSKLHQAKVQSLKATRQAIRSTRDVDSRIPEDGRYYDNLHDRIMSKVGKTEPKSRVWLHLQKNIQNKRAVVTLTVVCSVLILLGKNLDSLRFSERQNLITAGNIQQLILETTSRNPEVLSDSILSHEDDIDLYLDMASKKMESMGKTEKDQFMKSIKE